MERRCSAKVGKALFALCIAAILGALPAIACGTGGTTASPSTPVSGTYTMGTMALTSSTGAGDATVRGRISYTATVPEMPVLVDLRDASGRSIAETYAQDSFTFRGVTPGPYRMAIYAMETGYISQWYAGLPVQTHDVSESQLLQVGPGETQVDFVLEPGRSIQGRITWAGADRDGGWVWAYDPSGQETGRAAGFVRDDPRYVIVGLVPGQYKVGATADDAQEGPQVWYGGAHSAEDAALVDVTEADATGIDVDLGLLSPTTTEIPPPTTIPAPALPDQVPADFGFIAAYGVTARNVMDTFAGTFTKDLVLAGQATTDLRLTGEEKQSLYRDLVEMQSRWQLFTTPFSVEDTGGFVTPSATYHLECSVGDFSAIPIVWDDSNLSSDPKAVALRDWFDKLRRTIEAKPEYKALPPAEGGYD